MSEVSTSLSDPYAVKSGDTLSAIAKQCGCSVRELQRFNNLPNPNKLSAGKTLYLSERTAFGVSVLFLDAMRHPITNLSYQVRFDGRSVGGKTPANGQVPRQVTRDARSAVEVWIRNADQQWQQMISTVSGYGHRMITLVSPSVVIKGKTEAHPIGVSLKPEEPKALSTTPASLQPPLPKAAAGVASANNPRIKQQVKRAPQGQPIIEVAVDFPQELLNYFQAYTGGTITDEQWDQAADLIDCETAVLKAIAQVESGGREPFWRLNNGQGAHLPAILYERHYFSALTQKQYDADHPDISWPAGYLEKGELGKSNPKMSDGRVDAEDIYSSYATSYLRLLNAYHLDKNAALKACSWGKFQIMGANYGLCGERSLHAFVTKMSTSEIEQIGLLAEFIRRKPRAWKDKDNHSLGKEISLWDAVKTKNWQAIAFNFNGSAYRKKFYDDRLKEAYEKNRT